MKFHTLHELGHTVREVTLIDMERTGNPHAVHKGADIILVPHPSDDVNDPLRLPQWKKWIAFVNVLVFGFMINAWIGGLFPAFYTLSQDFDIDLATTAGLLTWCVFTAGLASFFWAPTAEYLGRRPVFLVTSLGMFLCEIWSGVATSYESLLVSRALGAFCGACTEALGAVVVNDLFYLHERGSKMGIYVIALYFGNSLGPIFTGIIVQYGDWHWTAWASAIIGGLNFIVFIFFFPETRWNRSINATGAKPKHVDIPATSNQPEIAEKEEPVEVIEHANTHENVELSGTKKTYLQELKPWSGRASQSWILHVLRPLPLFAYPAVAWGAFAYAVCLAWLLGAGTVTSFIFENDPYNFGTATSGLVNVGAMIGNVTGALAGGLLTDIWVKRCARRRGGKFVPEDRLVLLIIPFIIGPAGLLMFGFGAQRGLHWMVLYVGYAFISISPAAANIAMTYVLDSYPEVALEGMLIVNGVKQLVAFGFTYGFTHWVSSVGYQTVFGTMAGIWMFVLLTAIPLYIWGERVRNYSIKNMKVILYHQE